MKTAAESMALRCKRGVIGNETVSKLTWIEGENNVPVAVALIHPSIDRQLTTAQKRKDFITAEIGIAALRISDQGIPPVKLFSLIPVYTPGEPVYFNAPIQISADQAAALTFLTNVGFDALTSDATVMANAARVSDKYAVLQASDASPAAARDIATVYTFVGFALGPSQEGPQNPAPPPAAAGISST